ncbi:hypothetical protein AXY22_RS16235 [Acinetobacter baumannii]|uniref:Uncharacterized protein n=1 Tax=Acinetobacter baumannii MRSN 3527 TaxID=1409923 RepID=A0A0J0ZPY7_ACIBA|nr:hypothetical protein [Acinetobacter baumannii]ALJ87114.1 hypothetical protein AN415_01201 [Acinetobacter baumannii]EGJ62188.1 hypothetical protein HMPREF0021_00133 [Acinetobacter baumannii 6013150]EGJ63337.1 hypothetical protein HMPREF0020_03051 [Acinetobacter baumannii 6013113]EHU1797906.1 hypothetical protein [Acinetobacter baumannii]EHU2744526.1 hypothetical protein [Acinetobacter baumannii]
MHEKFEAWIKAQPFYTKLIYIHGERLFIRDNGEYQIFAMEVAYHAWLVQGGDSCKAEN